MVMNFINKEHELFWKEKNLLLKEYRIIESYYKALVYTLGICKTTRNNFNKIFDIEKGEINIDSINEPYQTSTSKKVTRMAFSLFNGCNYDSEDDIEKGQVSENYNVSDIFCCSYAPYFVNALEIRYPEYFRESIIDKELNKRVKEILKAEEKEMIGEKIKKAKQYKKEKER